MKKILIIGLAVALMVSFGGVAWAGNGHPAAKSTAEIAPVSVLELQTTSGSAEEDSTPWTTILVNTIKTPNQKDLLIDVALQCGLYTQTLVKSKAGKSDTSMAKAAIEVRVLVDGVEANPVGGVVYASRVQTMTAKFMGIFKEGCVIVDPDTGAFILNEDCLDPEELDLILDTMSANAFIFVVDDLLSGVHTVEVQARIITAAEADEGSAEAIGTIGKGSMSVEEVRFIQNENILMTE